MQTAENRWWARRMTIPRGPWLAAPMAAAFCLGIALVEFFWNAAAPRDAPATENSVAPYIVPALGLILVPLRAGGLVRPRTGRVVAALALGLLVIANAPVVWRAARGSALLALPAPDFAEPIWWASGVFIVGASAWAYVGFRRDDGLGSTPRGRRLAVLAATAIGAALVLPAPISFAHEVLSSGWRAERTFYRTFAMRSLRYGVSWSRPLYPQWLMRREAEYLAQRDVESGHIRLMGTGSTGVGLRGLEGGVPQPEGGRGGWTCRVLFYRDWRGTIVRVRDWLDEEPTVDLSAKNSAGNSVGSSAGNSAEIECTDGAGATRRFAAELVPMGCDVSDDQAAYNVAVVRRVLASK